MAQYNTFSLPFRMTVPMKANQVYALIPHVGNLLSGALIQSCPTYGGTYTNLVNSNVGPNGAPVNGQFVKALADTTVTITRTSF
jgi:hypothetical protein